MLKDILAVIGPDVDPVDKVDSVAGIAGAIVTSSCL
jgi:hypothetical protein